MAESTQDMVECRSGKEQPSGMGECRSGKEQGTVECRSGKEQGAVECRSDKEQGTVECRSGMVDSSEVEENKADTMEHLLALGPGMEHTWGPETGQDTRDMLDNSCYNTLEVA